MRTSLLLLLLAVLQVACVSEVTVHSAGDGGEDAGTSDAGVMEDAGTIDAGRNDAGMNDAGSTDDAGVEDPCPTLPIPARCFGRDVVFRDWGPTATGDGTYFADQAPGRLGFNRLNGRVWIVKFRVDANSYLGTISAYGDSVPGTAWISDRPCDATFALTHQLVAPGNHGGGTLNFLVVRDDADEQRLATDSTLMMWRYLAKQHLRGDHCYYAVFENTDSPPTPLTVDWFTTAPDWCGNATDPSCYYLAFDMDPLFTANKAIAGLSH